MDKPYKIKGLLKLFFDGVLDDADVAALNEALANSESARRDYLEAVYLREGMRKWARSRGVANEWEVIRFATGLEPQIDPSSTSNLVSGYEEPTDRGHPSANPSLSRGLRSRLAFFAAVSAAMLASASLYFQWPSSEPEARIDAGLLQSGDLTQSEENYALSDSDSVVARLTAATPDVRWSRGRVPSDFLMRFRPGDILGIDSGVAQVEFSDGARLVLCSPATLQFTGEASARLMKGCVTGRADSSNFTLVTPTATVVDIGTEFGIGVSPSGTDVTVFEGELHVHTLLNSGDGGPMRRVLEGMSMRIDSEGASVKLPGQAEHPYRRDLLQPADPASEEGTISLLDLVGGHDRSRERIAGSIDPLSGYWGKPPWLGPGRPKVLRGDTQFTATPWNRMVDGVFIPRANAREMQIDSDGHMVHLPPSSGTSWGPIWARRRSEIDRGKEFWSASHHDLWGSGTLEAVHARLLAAKEGLLGLHANVGITLDLDAVRDAGGAELSEFRAILLNLGEPEAKEDEGQRSQADLRIFVDGKLKYSRLQFVAGDGEVDVAVSLDSTDRFLTLVATDSDGDPELDHVVFVDPVFLVQEPTPLASRTPHRGLYAFKQATLLPGLGW